MFKVILRLFGAFSIFDSLVSGKWLAVERNGQKFGPTGQVLSVCKVRLTVKCLCHFQVIRRISDFPDFRQPCISKTAGCRTKSGHKFGPRWYQYLLSVYEVLLTVMISKSV